MKVTSLSSRKSISLSSALNQLGSSSPAPVSPMFASESMLPEPTDEPGDAPDPDARIEREAGEAVACSYFLCPAVMGSGAIAVKIDMGRKDQQVRRAVELMQRRIPVDPCKC